MTGGEAGCQVGVMRFGEEARKRRGEPSAVGEGDFG
jgi:hypothetical protein